MNRSTYAAAAAGSNPDEEPYSSDEEKRNVEGHFNQYIQPKQRHLHVGKKSAGIDVHGESEGSEEDKVEFLFTLKEGSSSSMNTKEETDEEDEVKIVGTMKPKKNGGGKSSKSVGTNSNEAQEANGESKREMNWKAQYDQAKAKFEEDGFANLSPSMYGWLYRMQQQMDAYESFLEKGGTAEVYDEGANKKGNSFTSDKVPQLKKLLIGFKKRPKKPRASINSSNVARFRGTRVESSSNNAHGSRSRSRSRSPSTRFDAGQDASFFNRPFHFDSSDFELPITERCAHSRNQHLYTCLVHSAQCRVSHGRQNRNRGHFKSGKMRFQLAQSILYVSR